MPAKGSDSSKQLLELHRAADIRVWRAVKSEADPMLGGAFRVQQEEAGIRAQPHHSSGTMSENCPCWAFLGGGKHLQDANLSELFGNLMNYLSHHDEISQRETKW